MLYKDIFRKKLLPYFSFEPSGDSFASRLNNHLPHYVSDHLDSGTLHINTFTIPWKNFYAFLPFAILEKVLQEVITDKRKGIVVAPILHIQPLYNLLLKLLIDSILAKISRQTLPRIENIS